MVSQFSTAPPLSVSPPASSDYPGSAGLGPQGASNELPPRFTPSESELQATLIRWSVHVGGEGGNCGGSLTGGG